MVGPGHFDRLNMPKKILILSGSPLKKGNTARLIDWFSEGASSEGAKIEVVHAASLKLKIRGCISCRRCQKADKYGCVVKDDANPVLRKMANADVIVMATPLYFFSASAQLKQIVDRMFSLYKWDNQAAKMNTVLKGKTLVLMLSAYENTGLQVAGEPFALIADYSGMKYESLLVPNSGESGQIEKIKGVRRKAIALGKKVAG